MKKQLLIFLTFCLSAFFICACQNQEQEGDSSEEPEQEMVSPFDQLPDSEAGDIVRKAIEWAGGWEKWAGKKTLSYTKITQYYDSTGTMEREARQLHQYQLHPQIKMNISWVEDQDRYTIINNGQQAWKLKNDKALTEKSDVNHGWNSSFGSQYVMCMPFKLADPGTVLDYEGLDTLANGEIVHSIKTTYEEGAGSAAGMHTWWYYFDQETYRPVANFLDYGNGYSYTQYEAFTEVDGIQLNQERKSYPSNAQRDLQAVRTIYKNEDVQLDTKLDDALFEPPN